MDTLLRAPGVSVGRAHAPFLVLLVAGSVLRLVAVATSPLATPGRERVLDPGVHLLVTLQHGTGIAIAAGVYLVLVRWGAWRWLAAVAAAPALLDGRVLAAEHAVDAASLACLGTSVVLVLLGWRDRPARVVVPVLAGCLLAVQLVEALASRSVGPFAGRLGTLLGAGSGSLAGYAGTVRVPDVLLLSALLVAVAAAAGAGRAERSRLRRPVLVAVAVPALMGLDLLSWPAPAWHETVPALVWWPAAGALGLTALLRGRRGPVAAPAAEDAVDRAAREEFTRRYGFPALAPVVAVIAAYNEADGLPRAVAQIPDQVLGLGCDVLVVDDGSTDGTAAALTGTRPYTVRCAVNRGQGAALRLGYRVALAHGARYLVTTDADGQYDVADLPIVLAPLLEDRADFVTGSRILGRQHTQDRVRRLGVHVFARLASVLVGQHLTDTSFGLRAMRAEVPAALTLAQPQYQSSELLLATLAHGFRVVEVPGTMRVRTAGTTKKGRNLVYGTRYARAMLGTWWREGCPRPLTDVPATRDVRRDATG